MEARGGRNIFFRIENKIKNPNRGIGNPTFQMELATPIENHFYFFPYAGGVEAWH